jgi:hypothetical protein
LNEVASVFELTVDRSEADVGHLVESPKVLHDHVAYNSSRHLPKVVAVDFAFNLADHGLKLVTAERSFVAGFFESPAQFAGIKWFPRLVFFDNLQRNLLNLLAGPNTALALVTNTPSSDWKTTVLAAGVDDGKIASSAKGTFHVWVGSPFVVGNLANIVLLLALPA